MQDKELKLLNLRRQLAACKCGARAPYNTRSREVSHARQEAQKDNSTDQRKPPLFFPPLPKGNETFSRGLSDGEIAATPTRMGPSPRPRPQPSPEARRQLGDSQAGDHESAHGRASTADTVRVRCEPLRAGAAWLSARCAPLRPPNHYLKSPVHSFGLPLQVGRRGGGGFASSLKEGGAKAEPKPQIGAGKGFHAKMRAGLVPFSVLKASKICRQTVCRSVPSPSVF